MALWGRVRDSDGAVHAVHVTNGRLRAVDGEQEWDSAAVSVLSPVLPSKIICVGMNYQEHAEELGVPIPSEPIIFLKPPTSVIGPGEDIIYPTSVQDLHYEGELAIVMGRRSRNIGRDDAYNYIAGFTLFNDVTARDMQLPNSQWTKAKCWDTFAPIGPFIADDVDPADLTIRTELNGELRQQGSLQDLIFDIPTLISYISRIMTLEEGDVIATGTPVGVGAMAVGDEVRISAEGIGILANSIAAE